jgi:hypothetical protein
MSTRKNTEPESQPSTGRRALLASGAVGLAAVAGATLGRATPASAQDTTQDVTWLMPSNDATGATDYTNISSWFSAGNYFLWLGPGAFYIDNVIDIPHKATLLGTGPDTRVYCVTSSGATPTNGGFYMHDTDGGDGSSSKQNSSGCIRDLIIDGSLLASGASSTGLDIGDGWGYRLDHVFVENFTGASSIGFRIGNDYYFTEKMVGTSLHARNCTTLVYMNTTIGNDVSHGYNDLEFYISLNPGSPPNLQSAFTFDDGVNYYGGSLRVRGNQYYLADAPDPGPWFFGLVGSIANSGVTYYSQILECFLDVRVEGDPDSGDPSNEYSVNRLHVQYAENGIFDCFGRFTMTGSNGDPDAVSGQFQLSGLVPSNSMVPIRTEAPDWEPQPTITTPTIATGTAIANSTGCNVMVYLDGGTLTAATKINSTAVGDTSTRQYYLPQGQTIKLTYSGSPSWQWQPVR